MATRGELRYSDKGMGVSVTVVRIIRKESYDPIKE